MPGGSPAKRVFTAVAAASSKPNVSAKHGVHSAEKEWKDQISATAEDASPFLEDKCDVQPFEVWYWAEDGSFISETMYLNAGDIAHSTAEPRLVVSLSNFEALSQAYAWSVEREGISKELLHEKEETLARVRLGYFKELQHLREILDMARVQIRMAKSGRDLNEAEQRRMAEYEHYVNRTDVNFFDIVECLDPELKSVMKNAVKQFNDQLMKETFDLNDRLSLYESNQSDSDLPGRLLALLMSKGHTPAMMVKVLSGFVEDKKQSDEFNAALKEFLGVGPRLSAPEPQEDDHVKHRARRRSVEPPQPPQPEHMVTVTQQPSQLVADRSDVEQKLREELFQAKRQIARMEQETEARPDSTGGSVAEVKDLQQQLAHAQAQLDDLRKKEQAHAAQSVQAAQPVVAAPTSDADRERQAKAALDRANKEIEELKKTAAEAAAAAAAAAAKAAKPEPQAEPKAKADAVKGVAKQLKDQLARQQKENEELRRELEEARLRKLEPTVADCPPDGTESTLRGELAQSRQQVEELQGQLQAAKAQINSVGQVASTSAVDSLKQELVQTARELELAREQLEKESVGRRCAEQALEKEATARLNAEDVTAHLRSQFAPGDAIHGAEGVGSQSCVADPSDQATVHRNDVSLAERFAECDRRRLRAESNAADLERRIAELNAHIRRLTEELRDTQVSESAAFSAVRTSTSISAIPGAVALESANNSQNYSGRQIVAEEEHHSVHSMSHHLDFEASEFEGTLEGAHESTRRALVVSKRPKAHGLSASGGGSATFASEATAPAHAQQPRSASKSSSSSANRKAVAPVAPLPMQNVDLVSASVASLAAHSPASSMSSKFSFHAAQDPVQPTRMPSLGALDSSLGSLKKGPAAPSDSTRPSTGDVEVPAQCFLCACGRELFASTLSGKLAFHATQDPVQPTRMPSQGTLDSSLGSLKKGLSAASDTTTGDFEVLQQPSCTLSSHAAPESMQPTRIAAQGALDSDLGLLNNGPSVATDIICPNIGDFEVFQQPINKLSSSAAQDAMQPIRMASHGALDAGSGLLKKGPSSASDTTCPSTGDFEAHGHDAGSWETSRVRCSPRSHPREPSNTNHVFDGSRGDNIGSYMRVCGSRYLHMDMGHVPLGAAPSSGGSLVASEFDVSGPNESASNREQNLSSRRSFSGTGRRMRQRSGSISVARIVEPGGGASSPDKRGITRQRTSSTLPGISAPSIGSHRLASSMPDLVVPCKRRAPNSTLQIGPLFPKKALGKMEADRSTLDLQLNIGEHIHRKVPFGRKLSTRATRMSMPGHNNKPQLEKSFILAARAFELGNHVRRHAEAEFQEMRYGRQAMTPAVHNLVPFAAS